MTSTEDLLRSDLACGIGKAFGVPMNLLDGRPWAPTHDEAHDPILYGTGRDEHGVRAGCGHPDCLYGPEWGRNLTGLFNTPGATRRD